jgi:hypothetical protein
MSKTAFLGSLALVLMAGTVGAQESAPPADQPQQDETMQDERLQDEMTEYEEGVRDPRPKIKVLQNPYDLAGFYRSSQGSFLDYRPEGSYYQDRYPIAGYYRLRGAGDRRGYAQFWTNGYSSSRPRFTVGYRRRIGENGDLFLFAPTFLSPIGPLTDAFFDR